jgi:hypothetical protein
MQSSQLQKKGKILLAQTAGEEIHEHEPIEWEINL